VDGAPKVLKPSCNKAEADEITKKITAGGGQVTIKGL
jgi:ribosomal protein L7/L12